LIVERAKMAHEMLLEKDMFNRRQVGGAHFISINFPVNQIRVTPKTFATRGVKQINFAL
jgi:hypothetical protein